VGFDFSYYDRNTEDQIVPIQISGSAGYTSRVINAGKINNKGVELLLYGSPLRTNDYGWDITLNFARNRNTVMELPEGLDRLQLAAAPFGGALLTAVEGATFQELISL
jgi:outer membrane receptor protein involved in Fe transport